MVGCRISLFTPGSCRIPPEIPCVPPCFQLGDPASISALIRICLGGARASGNSLSEGYTPVYALPLSTDLIIDGACRIGLAVAGTFRCKGRFPRASVQPVNGAGGLAKYRVLRFIAVATQWHQLRVFLPALLLPARRPLQALSTRFPGSLNISSVSITSLSRTGSTLPPSTCTALVLSGQRQMA